MGLGVPGQDLDGVASRLRLARVPFGPAVKGVSLAWVPDAGLGAWVRVHLGLALHVLEEAKYMPECLEKARCLSFQKARRSAHWRCCGSSPKARARPSPVACRRGLRGGSP